MAAPLVELGSDHRQVNGPFDDLVVVTSLQARERVSHSGGFWTERFLHAMKTQASYTLNSGNSQSHSQETAAVFLTALVSRGEKSPVEVSTTCSASCIASFGGSIPVSFLCMLAKPRGSKRILSFKFQAAPPIMSAKNPLKVRL